jgi:hypothetical protein
MKKQLMGYLNSIAELNITPTNDNVSNLDIRAYSNALEVDHESMFFLLHKHRDDVTIKGQSFYIWLLVKFFKFSYWLSSFDKTLK